MVILVSGLPRSGTSLMMQMLEAGGLPVLSDGVRGADEDNPRGYFEFEKVKQTSKDPSWLDQAEGKVVKVISQLLFELPAGRPCRVIFMLRPMGEILASQKEMLARRKQQGSSLDDKGLAAAFASHLERAKKWLAEQPDFEVLYVPYHDVLADPGAWAVRLRDFLGREMDTEAMAAAVDPALYRHRSA